MAKKPKLKSVISRKKVDADIERQIITGMIVSERYLREVLTIYQKDLLKTPYAKTIAGWCIKYFKQYNTNPGIHIQDIFESHKRKKLDPDQADLIENFLASISKEYERAAQFNVSYLLDETEKKFKTRALTMLAEDIQAALALGDLVEAESLLVDFKIVSRPSGNGVNPLTDVEALSKSFSSGSEVLFRLPGALGQLIGDISRADFISFVANEKRGKSWVLIDFAMRAIKHRCNVAMFQVGDMSQEQTIKRIHVYNTKGSVKFSGKKLIPVLDCYNNQTGECDLPERASDTIVLKQLRTKDKKEKKFKKLDYYDCPEHVPCTFCQKEGHDTFKGAVWYREMKIEKISWKYALAEAQKLEKRYGADRFKLACFPSNSVSVQDIKNQLEIWQEFNDFIADVVLIDYADLLKPSSSRLEFRHQQNDIWSSLRGLSLEKHIALITATQASKVTFRKKSIEQDDLSEDKRKMAHVTHMFAINQTPEEKRQGIYRMATLAKREDDFDVTKEVKVLYSYAIGRSYLASYF
jgi:hypothetical protein